VHPFGSYCTPHNCEYVCFEDPKNHVEQTVNLPVPTDWCHPGLLRDCTHFKRQSQDISISVCLK